MTDFSKNCITPEIALVTLGTTLSARSPNASATFVITFLTASIIGCNAEKACLSLLEADSEFSKPDFNSLTAETIAIIIAPTGLAINALKAPLKPLTALTAVPAAGLIDANADA